MADVNYRDTVIPEAANQAEKPGNVAALQAARGFIHQYYSRVGRHCPADFDDLPQRDWQGSNLRFRTNLRMVEIGGQAQGSIASSFEVHQPARRRFNPHYNVLSDSQVRE